jgi:hypothetical protein
MKFLRYQFLVYNASVIYFNCVRPFFRDGYRKYLCNSFQQVIDTLINIDNEQDFPWQAELLLYDIFIFLLIKIFYFYSSELVRCYMDANNIDKARDVSTQLLQLCQTKQLPLLSNILQFLVRF